MPSVLAASIIRVASSVISAPGPVVSLILLLPMLLSVSGNYKTKQRSFAHHYQIGP
jgi:hypothetical protein